MGFPAPFDKWLRDERFRDEIKKYIVDFEKRNIVDSMFLKQHYIEHMTGEENWATDLFRIMNLEIWFQNEIDAPEKKWIFEAV